MKNTGLVKPATLLKEDFVQGLVDLCNNSGLPLFIVESILKDFIQDVHVASQKQLETDRVNYANELQKLQAKSSPVKDGD